MYKVSLHRSLERPLPEALKFNPGLPWTIQDDRDIRVMEYLSSKADNRSQHKRKNCVAVKKAEQS